MKIVFTGGGSAGHVIPNTVIIDKLLPLGYDVCYIGSQDGLEREIIEKTGLPYHKIKSGKLRRYKDIKNVTDIFRIAAGFFQSLNILRRQKPVVLFSKGGYVACPVVWAAWMRRIPVIIHESDLTPGLANKLSLPFAKKVCYTFPETLEYLDESKAVLTGIPVRRSLFKGQKEKGLSLCGFDDGKPVILIIGGSQGSKIINDTVRAALPDLLAEFNICHICGYGNREETLNQRGYCQFEYVDDDLSHLFVAADLVVSRAGATVLFELLALKKPNLLIPLSKAASRGDQIQNAASFAKRGFSLVLPEEELNRAALLKETKTLYEERDVYVATMKKNVARNAEDIIIDIIRDITV